GGSLDAAGPARAVVGRRGHLGRAEERVAVHSSCVEPHECTGGGGAGGGGGPRRGGAGQGGAPPAPPRGRPARPARWLGPLGPRGGGGGRRDRACGRGRPAGRAQLAAAVAADRLVGVLPGEARVRLVRRWRRAVRAATFDHVYGRGPANGVSKNCCGGSSS